ncbi:MAG: response regulator transcription factor [Armatimonadetes bacterium]|nr:response regulator transcription factor [Armatimonadota bacterium]
MPQQVLVLGDEDLIESLQSAGMPGGAVGFTRVRSLDDLLAALDESWDALLIVWDGVPDPKEESFRALAAQTDVPIVVLADQPDVDLVVDILDWGGDECLPRELSPREIVTHLRAQIRRVTDYSQPLAEATRLEVGHLRVDLAKHTVALDDEIVELTPREFDLLVYLARNAGRAVPREEIIEQVWAGEISARSRSLDVHIGRLRAKLEDDPQHPTRLTTVTGVGYRLEEQ